MNYHLPYPSFCEDAKKQRATSAGDNHTSTGQESITELSSSCHQLSEKLLPGLFFFYRPLKAITCFKICPKGEGQFLYHLTCVPQYQIVLLKLSLHCRHLRIFHITKIYIKLVHLVASSQVLRGHQHLTSASIQRLQQRHQHSQLQFLLLAPQQPICLHVLVTNTLATVMSACGQYWHLIRMHLKRRFIMKC